ncbi:penicillin-binding protein 1C [Desulforhopalus vacuolatus]|uniref:penicillin-binding protein 1C n=1 Tax=Desulforhopalus vacuolatus TaxID=40414 RepID=UPI00196664EC|nr:penicillin-binding protein 1C [Desulforhopalus vacuolatus]MBM9518358.1 penicillin-binding protein 1C [Desulforhopalus vacuolatus]
MKWRCGKILRLLLFCVLACAAGTAVFIFSPNPQLEEPEWSAQVVSSDGESLRIFTTADGRWRLKTDLQHLDPRFLHFLLACEDSRFYRHPGVDGMALLRAVGQLVTNGRVISGASTITMQTVRLLHPRPRTVASKVVEMVEALRLEQQLGREEILTLYLSLAPYGGNIEGIEAATRLYFNKSPQYLTPSEAALLIALPQSPESRRPDRFPERAKEARDRILQRLNEVGLLSAEESAVAAAVPVPTRRFPMPFLAPQLALRLHTAFPQQRFVRTTLDGPTERHLHSLAFRVSHELEPGLTFAVLVVENDSRRVIGYLGSGNFFTDSQLDLTRAVRSPGSTLKPFIYGIAFERGLLHPESWIDDSPCRFGLYRPRNFDGRFHGEISVREALQRSLNVPAVAVLRRIGPLRFVARLAKAGVLLRFQGEANLPLALGGGGATLEELVTLYADLADGGRIRPLRWLEDVIPEKPSGENPRLLSPLAAWYVDDILKDMPFPPGQQGSRDVRFKTGTSYGFRDAWAVGYNRYYTAGVWVGRPDGSFGRSGTGSSLAVPLLFNVFASLPPHSPRAALPAPPGALQVRHVQLPAALKRFDRPGISTSRSTVPLKILFPPDGSVLPLLPGQKITLKAQGGTPPLHWLCNGRPLPVTPGRSSVRCNSDGIGWSEAVVIDSEGDQVAVRFKIETQ